mgnify:CR=1 FL=1
MLLCYYQEAFNYKISARPDRRRQFEKELASAMEVALSILTACLNFNEFKEQVGPFFCLLAVYCCSYISNTNFLIFHIKFSDKIY